MRRRSVARLRSDPFFPGGELMVLQHVLYHLRDDVSELAFVGGDDVDHAIDHLLRIHLAFRRGEEIVETLAQIGALCEVDLVVEPAERIVRHRLVITRVIGARIDGLDLDPILGQLLLHGFGECLQRMLGRNIGAPVGGGEQAAHGRSEDDLATLALAHPFLDNALGKGQWQEDVDLVILADKIDGDFPDRAGFAHACIVPEYVEVPGLRLLDIIRVGQIEPLHAQVGEAEGCGFLSQRGHLRGYVDGGDDVVAILGHADGRSLAEARASAGDEDGLGGHDTFIPFTFRWVDGCALVGVQLPSAAAAAWAMSRS